MDKPDIKNPSIYKKIHKVMEEIKSVHKSKKHKQNYSYASAEAFISLVRDEMIKQKLVIGGSKVIGEPITIPAPSRSGNGFLVAQVIEYIIADVETGETISFQIPSQGWDMMDKGVYKAHTGGYKYFLRTAFMLEMTDDPENDQSSQYQPTEENQTSNNSNGAFDKAKKEIEEQRKVLMDEIKGIRLQMEDSGYQFDKDEITFFDKLDTVKYAVPELKNKVIPKLKEKQKMWDDSQFPEDEKKVV